MNIGVGGSVLLLTLTGYQSVSSLVNNPNVSVLSQFSNNQGNGVFNGFVPCSVTTLQSGEIYLVNTDNTSRFLRAAPDQLVMADGGPKAVKDLNPTELLIPFGNATPAQYQKVVAIQLLNPEMLYNVQIGKTKNCIANGLTILNS